MAEEILTLYNFNASLQKFSLHFYYSYLGQKASPQNEWLQNLDLQCFISEIKWISQHIKFLFQSHDISTLQGGQSIIIMILSVPGTWYKQQIIFYLEYAEYTGERKCLFAALVSKE